MGLNPPRGSAAKVLGLKPPRGSVSGVVRREPREGRRGISMVFMGHIGDTGEMSDGDGDIEELPWLSLLKYWPEGGRGAVMPAMVAAICWARTTFLSLAFFSQPRPAAFSTRRRVQSAAQSALLILGGRSLSPSVSLPLRHYNNKPT